MALMKKLNKIKTKKKEFENLSKDVNSKTVEKMIAENQDKRKKFIISIGISIFIAVIFVLIFNCFFAFVTVNGDSMYPTYDDGKSLIIQKTGLDDIQNSDVVVFKNKTTNGELYIKRVIAGGGDLIKIDGLKVFLNGEILNENYVNNYSSEVYTGVIEIPEGYYYVMGDNRDDSIDSREIGLISQEDLIGKVLFE